MMRYYDKSELYPPLTVPLWLVIVLVSLGIMGGLALGIWRTQQYYESRPRETWPKPAFSCRLYQGYRREMDRICKPA